MIRLCFGRANNLKSRLIRWSTAGIWSHVWGEFDLYGKTWALHSSTDGVQILSVERIRSQYSSVVSIRVSVSISDTLAEAHRYLGAGYDYGVIPNVVLLVLFRWTGVVWFDPRRDPNKFSCSELWCALLKKQGVPCVQRRDPELTTPQNLADDFGINV